VTSTLRFFFTGKFTIGSSFFSSGCGDASFSVAGATSRLGESCLFGILGVGLGVGTPNGNTALGVPEAALCDGGAAPWSWAMDCS
jgi:hypothetical protein